ncbi:MAG TPA: glycosyltransferase family 87 protein [Candidatus Sulfotelmatobacter sp.]|nr:glycosyltransferase family 87 protein [Candidatus Sulfotelmatobacter sp.]
MTLVTWMDRFAEWLTLRRIRTHALILALCLWGVCIIDYATPGIFDRAGNIKFQDFIQFHVAARLIALGRAGELYNPQVLTNAVREIAGPDSKVQLQYFYGPQVALPFLLITPLSFLHQAELWVAISLLIYFACIYALWRTCPALKRYPGLVALCAVAYPPVYHFFVRGHLSVVPLACFTAAFLALRARRQWLAGIALGLLFVKPPILVAIPLILIFAGAWRILTGLVISTGAQLAFAYFCFGTEVMRSYFHMLLQSARQPGTTELALSPIQMHSLRSFWGLLIPSSAWVWPFYLLTSFAVIGIAARIWNSASPLAIRFAGLVLASALVNPHLYIYDLLVLAPALLLLVDWSLANSGHDSASAIGGFVYLSFTLPLIGPVSRWTHLQLSVLAFAALLCVLAQLSPKPGRPSAQKLATAETAVV